MARPNPVTPTDVVLVTAAAAGGLWVLSRLIDGAGRSGSSPSAIFGGGSRSPGGTALYTLRSQAFPGSGWPGVLVHIPPGFDASRPLDLLVYFRGFNSCVSVLAGDHADRCRPGGPTHKHSDLVGQFDRAGVNAVLIMPELRVEEATGDAGQLGSSGAFQRFLAELLGEQLAPLGLQPVRRVALACHSGGYTATAAVLERGGVEISGPIGLFDALYGNVSTFANAAERGLRLLDLYTDAGGTDSNSRSLGQRLRGSLGASVVLDDRASAPTAEEWAARVLIKRVPEDHSSVPLHYFGPFVAQCGFDPL